MINKGRCLCQSVQYDMHDEFEDVLNWTLDTDLNIKPAHHIYVVTKALWYDISDDLPQQQVME
ncbi:hypothetical protein [uncultured Shewanella sp.]|uniref:hypothetical protein n=1 Tax=uncultured Shewanella sp. TaxID=173975 RepID=UPI00260ABC98|nr:hypothetical protein [uncultured Shewanella sp.]